MHGQGFTPGASVILLLDDSVTLAVQQDTAGRTSAAAGMQPAAALGVLSAAQPQSAMTSNGIVRVGRDGTFSVTVMTDPNWSRGSHTIRAKEITGSRSAQLSFKIVAQPAQLGVRPTAIDLGKLQVGMKVIIPVLVSNLGGQQLSWTADARGTRWVNVQTNTGTIEPGSLGQFIRVAVDTTHLALGDYAAVVRISSNGGEAQVALKLRVIPKVQKLQAKLNVSRSSLEYGTWQVGNQVTLQMAVSNLGTQRLTWKVDSGVAHWLVLDRTAGTIEPDGLPEVVYVTADTSQLPAGAYSALLHISSNGGNRQIQATLGVTAPPRQSTPTVTHGPPPQLQVDPTRFPDVNSDCSYTYGDGWVCIAEVRSDVAAQGDLHWSASSSRLPGVTFYPSHGTLAPGEWELVYILIPDMQCRALETFAFTFKGPANTVEVPWSCQPQPLHLIVSPMQFEANTDCSSANNDYRDWQCTAFVSSDPRNQRDLHWSASSRGAGGATFSPSNGTLSPGQWVEVTITVDTACWAHALFTFRGGAQPITVPWHCEPAAMLRVSPGSFSDQSCAQLQPSIARQSDSGWICTAHLEAVGNTGSGIDWSASASSSLADATFSQPSGTVSSGSGVSVSIFVPSSDCQGGAFSFTGPANTVMVPWSCTQPPLLQVSQSSIDANTDCSYKDGWTCMLILSTDQNAQRNLNWSASGGNSGTSFSPSRGTLSPGQPEQVTISVSPVGCHEHLDLTFIGGAEPVTVGWDCYEPTLIVSHDSFGVPDPNCSYTLPSAGSGGWSCTETLSLSGPGDPDLNWSTPGSVGGNSAVQYNPASGTLSAGQKRQVTITIPDIVCPASTTLTFQGAGGNPITVPWSCAAPQLTASAEGNCPRNSDGSWTCTDTLALARGSQGDLKWSASAGSDLPAATFSPPNGTLVPSQSMQVNVSIPANDCSTGHYSYAGEGANTVSVAWNCLTSPTPAPTSTPTPTPMPTSTPTPTISPLLAVSPTSLDTTSASGCTLDSNSNTWTCTVTLSEDSSAQGDINWSASSDLSGVSFNKPSGTLTPGQSATVTISAIPCSNGSFTFSGGEQPVAVSWICSAAPSPTATPTAAPTDTPTPIPTDTPTPTPVPPTPTPVPPTPTPTSVPPTPTPSQSIILVLPLILIVPLSSFCGGTNKATRRKTKPFKGGFLRRLCQGRTSRE